jgi:hypothetical protein
VFFVLVSNRYKNPQDIYLPYLAYSGNQGRAKGTKHLCTVSLKNEAIEN